MVLSLKKLLKQNENKKQTSKGVVIPSDKRCTLADFFQHIKNDRKCNFAQ